ncbi:hypothetical protein FACS1894208_00540 [Clostridia bacterium]|nr:hypothetical protein FACS1894208_00540 [Clostridia bacterium]
MAYSHKAKGKKRPDVSARQRELYADPEAWAAIQHARALSREKTKRAKAREEARMSGH